MSEEEIIEQINNIIYDLNAVNEDWYDEDEIATAEYQVKYIQGLLDLYNKQQKEIEKLKKPKFIMNAETGEITKIHNDFISKDKIRDILLKFQNKYSPYLETTGRLFIGKEVVQYGEDILDEMAKELDIELLEEE